MGKVARAWLAALAWGVAASPAFAGEGDTAPAPDAAQPAVGEWVGSVSWNEPPMSYAWRIDPDGTFASGRAGRGYSGGGAWGVHGAQLTLKYEDGFRYEGELHADAYSGAAYTVDGRAFGSFSIWRVTKDDGPVGSDAPSLAR